MSITASFCIERGDFSLDVDLTMPSKGITAIFGPSGGGKTTLLRAIAGLERTSDGYLQVDETVWQDGTYFEPPHQRALGYVFQEPSLFPHLSVRENLDYGLSRVDGMSRQITLEEAANMVGVESFLDRQPHGLSGGERQRVAIARALLTSPRLLLMDEPLAALDLSSKAEILFYLRELHEEFEIPILYVSHTPAEVGKLADYLVLLAEGQVQGHDPIADMLTRVDLPLAHRSDAESIIEAQVTGHEDKFGLTYLDFAGGIITVPREDLPVGRRVRIRILARDISLAVEKPSASSILNVIPATITDRVDEGPAQVTIRLTCEGIPLLSRITRKSAVRLGLDPGTEVYAQVKSVALLV